MNRRRNKGRPVNGILLLDKPHGITSNQALQKVKRLFRARKAGHTGNLDPMASGVLPICLGEATKMSAFLLDADKGYRGTIKLGVRTSSADAEGEVIERCPVPELREEQIREVLARFTGDIRQIPPMHSALKHQGQPLYKLARQGVEVERKPRSVTIYRLELLGFADDEIEVEILCSKGTYVRTLAEEIGAALGSCAHLGGLVRTSAGPFELERSVTMERLEREAAQGLEALDGLLLPIESALADRPAVTLPRETAHYFCKGQPVFVPRVSAEGWVRIYGGEGRFLGVGTVQEDGRVAPKRLLSASPS
ncbi:MAG TPA: tRNA pseudouridine(55) synthase TruB [Gammaproteobacteria bacterium]|nr:tRNA pseudouridine(55) synthase TruB [Gammaproteobacteria bacterium]